MYKYRNIEKWCILNVSNAWILHLQLKYEMEVKVWQEM